MPDTALGTLDDKSDVNRLRRLECVIGRTKQSRGWGCLDDDDAYVPPALQGLEGHANSAVLTCTAEHSPLDRTGSCVYFGC